MGFKKTGLLISAEQIEILKKMSWWYRLNHVEHQRCGRANSGGISYWNMQMEYPMMSNGKPLVLLAQFCMEELPQTAYLPKMGLLQFFISDEPLLGMRFNQRKKQNCFRVVYHPKIDYALRTENVLELGIKASEISRKGRRVSREFPVKGEFVVSAQLEKTCMGERDRNYWPLLEQIAREKGFIPTDAFLDCNNNVKEPSQQGSRLFGYPFFTQYDPRPEGRYDTLLFQMDTQQPYVKWGDQGVAGFFVDSVKSQNTDFQDVFYTWDCL